MKRRDGRVTKGGPDWWWWPTFWKNDVKSIDKLCKYDGNKAIAPKVTFFCNRIVSPRAKNASKRKKELLDTAFANCALCPVSQWCAVESECH